jgi:FtsH-binding integral membrane protein
MKPWLRRLHIILTIGGSFTGAVLTLQGFFTTKEANPLLYAMYVCFIGLYVYGIIAGLRFAEKEEDKKSLIVFYWLQVPWISSPIIGYRFTSGFHISGAFIGDKMSGFFRLGSDWQFNLFQAIPWGVGLNIFALVMVLLLMKKKEPIQPPQTTTGSSAPGRV